MALLAQAIDFTFEDSSDFSQIFKPSKHTGRPRRVRVVEDYFDEIGVEQAYWLGFIYADGSVCWKRWALAVNLKESDRHHLEKLQSVLGGSLFGSVCARFIACSKKLCESLAWRGIVPNKTYHPVQPPTFQESMVMRAFLRGMFDGDGCLHINKRGGFQAAFCGHPAIVEWFVEMVGVRGSSRFRGRTLYYQWTSEPAAQAVAGFLYDAPGPVLDRKAALAEEGCYI